VKSLQEHILIHTNKLGSTSNKEECVWVRERRAQSERDKCYEFLDFRDLFM